MRHAAHKARNAQRSTIAAAAGRAREVRAAHTAAVVYANTPMALVPEVAKAMNEAVPRTRRALRQAAKQQAHKKQFVTASAFALLAATAGSFTYASSADSTGLPLANGDDSSVIANDSVAPDDASSVAAGSTTQVSRSEARTPVSDSAQWSMTSSVDEVDASQMSKSTASNAKVAALMDRDAADLPAGFDPNHATGDSGNAYSFSQCTWWAYTRRHQLGLPVGSYFGDGAMWADSARSHGYWVDNTPRVGDVMVFQRGQEGASAQYGHVAIVEKVNADGSVTTSECGASYHGKTFSRTFKNVHDFQYIHY